MVDYYYVVDVVVLLKAPYVVFVLLQLVFGVGEEGVGADGSD